MDRRQRVGRRIQTMRKSLGLTQDEVAEQLGVTRSAVSFWEHGQREMSIEMVNAMADVLNCRPSAIIEDEIPGEDDELWQLREAMRRNPDVRVLFDLSKNASPQAIKRTVAVLKALKDDDEG